MRKLKIPLEEKSVKDIFLDCIENLQDKDALQQCADMIQEDTKDYRTLAPLQLASVAARALIWRPTLIMYFPNPTQTAP